MTTTVRDAFVSLMIVTDDEDDDEDDDDAAEDDEVDAAAEDTIFGIEKPVLIRLALMSCLTVGLNLMLPKPSTVAERQSPKPSPKNVTEVADDTPAPDDTLTEVADDDIEVFEEEDDDLPVGA